MSHASKLDDGSWSARWGAWFVRIQKQRAGWGATGPAPEVPELSGVRADVLMVTPETLLPPTLARAFLARGRRRSA